MFIKNYYYIYQKTMGSSCSFTIFKLHLSVFAGEFGGTTAGTENDDKIISWQVWKVFVVWVGLWSERPRIEYYMLEGYSAWQRSILWECKVLIYVLHLCFAHCQWFNKSGTDWY